MKRIYHPAKKKTILIVDDDPVVIQIYREKFQRQGFKVEVAGNADSAMVKLTTDPIDLVILDLSVPGMNGIELLKNIRSEHDVQALPVIVISNAYLSNLRRATLDAGATKCVAKADSTPQKMLALVRELLAVGHSHAAGVTPKFVVRNAAGTLASQPETEFEKKLVATFLINAPVTLAKLRTSVQLFARTQQEDLRQAQLSEMHRQIRPLACSANLLGFRKIAPMADALEALFIELHAKPAKITPSVIRTVAQAVDILAALSDKATDLQTEVLVPPRILVVDDEVISRETICSALAKANLTAVSLEDSLAAERLLEQEHFNLIFLDIEMPGKNGLELCTNIRQTAWNRTTPVVFVTAHADFGSRAQSTLSGGNDFIAKPFLLVELVVKALTCLIRESLSALSTVTAQTGAPVEPGSHESQASGNPAALSVNEQSIFEPPKDALLHRTEPPLSLFTREELLKQCDGDDELMGRLIALFHENTPRLLDDIRGSIARRSSSDLARSAHALLSSLGAFGANDATHLTRQLETQAHDKDYENTDYTFAALERGTAEIDVALAGFTPARR
jgi:DNA-binding response OmpR family regulator